MSVITDRRAELRAEARKRERTVLPKLRAKVRGARKRKADRLKRCQTDCQRRRERVRKQAEAARKQLRARLAAAKAKARDFCGLCKVSATGAELDSIDAALAALEGERETIRQLRARASGLVDPRGQAAGRRSAELRAELEDEVRRNVDDDPELEALWEAQRDRYRRFAPTRRATMTERFLEWVESHPEALDELRARREVAWEREADELLKRWPRAPIADMTEPELEALHRDHDRASSLLGDEPDADTLRFAELVHEAARASAPTAATDDGTVFLRTVYNTLRRRGEAITWPQFASSIMVAYSRGAVRLRRWLGGPRHQQKLAEQSRVPNTDGGFNLLVIPESVPF